MSAIAHFDSHRRRCERRFGSVDAAVAWLAQEEEIGELAALRIVVGDEIIEGDELRDRLFREPVFSRDFLEGTF